MLMRKLIYFALLVTVIPLFAACKKSISTGSQENFEHYIFFGHQVESKASLINGKDDVQSFGVVGFKYDNTTSWDEYKTKTECTPNVFFDETNSPVDVETLNCTKGSPPSYTPLQGWSNTRKYTFFAFYYPIDNKNVDIVSADGSKYKGGVPAIKYSLNTGDLQGSMVDVMVSEPCTDLYYNSAQDNNIQGSEVKLQFNHILSALGVNFTKETENTITINGVSMTISGIQYQTYIYPLDGAAATPGGSTTEGSFVLSIPEEEEEDGVIVSSESAGTEIADKLIFIPQSGNATISLTIEYTRSAAGVSFTDKKSFIGIKTAFGAGKKHLIQLKFTDSTVEVKSDVTSSAWTDAWTVNNTFN